MANDLLIPDSSMPLYEQLANHLRTDIALGKYLPGKRLPTEADLCDIYNVSRITVRRATKELIEEELLEAKQGKGVFVAMPKVTIHAMALDGFSSFGKIRDSEKGRERNITIHQKTKRSPTTKECRLLEINKNEIVAELTRTLAVDGVPIMLDRSVYAESRFPGMLEKVEESTSTYRLMSTVYHHENIKARKEISITSAHPLEAQFLLCKVGEALFCIEKVTCDENDVVNHLSTGLCVASRVKMTLAYSQTDRLPY
ncbi:MAG: UTRA domain-containing protein [Clostridiales bacterium]|nr:UTRA domain-containing protein [Clostridiales bacterium]